MGRNALLTPFSVVKERFAPMATVQGPTYTRPQCNKMLQWKEQEQIRVWETTYGMGLLPAARGLPARSLKVKVHATTTLLL